MLLQWSAPEYMPHSFQVSGLSGTVGHKQTGNCFDLTKQVADGFVQPMQVARFILFRVQRNAGQVLIALIAVAFDF